MRAHLILVMLVAVPAVSAAQSQRSGEPVVQVGIYGYQADGRITVSAGDIADRGPEFGTTVYLIAQPQRCGMGAGNRTPPADAVDAWQFTGNVLSATSEQAVVQLNWRRLILQGRAVDGDQSSTQLTLRAGESVQLDQATPGCQTVSVAFEVGYLPRFLVGQSKGGGAGGRASAGPAGGTVAVNRGRAPRSSGSGTSVPVAQAGGEGGGVRLGADSSVGRFDVNLWLVRSVPGQPDEVTHSQLRMNHDGASFSFAPIAVTTSRGDAIVQVTGSLAVVRGSSGEEQLVFTTARRVMHTTAQTPRDAAETQGSSRIVNRMPGPDEVLSFEMPPIKVNNQQAAPDQLSVRLKIAPRR